MVAAEIPSESVGRESGVYENSELTSIPRDAVESLADGWYKWRGYCKQALSFEHAYELLNAAWLEIQQRTAVAKRMDAQRRRQLQHLDTDETRFSNFTSIVLKKGSNGHVIKGRYRTDGRKLTFIEDSTWHQIILDLPATVNEHGRGFDAFLDKKLYDAVLAQHAKAKRDVKQAVRHEQAEQRCPKVPGDMGIRRISGG